MSHLFLFMRSQIWNFHVIIHFACCMWFPASTKVLAKIQRDLFHPLLEWKHPWSSGLVLFFLAVWFWDAHFQHGPSQIKAGGVPWQGRCGNFLFTKHGGLGCPKQVDFSNKHGMSKFGEQRLAKDFCDQYIPVCKNHQKTWCIMMHLLTLFEVLW